MSAFLCSHTHINSIVAFVEDQHKLHGFSAWTWLKVDGPQQLAERLYAENVKSYRIRYEHIPEIHAEIAAAGAIFYRQPLRTLTPIEVIKAVHCLQYQCNETEDWPTSQAAQNLHHIVHQAASVLPGYDAAPWSIEPDQAETADEADPTQMHNGDDTDAPIITF